MSTPDPIITIMKYEVSCFPEGDTGRHYFSVEVEYRSPGLYAVTRHGKCLSRTGDWSYEFRPSEREDEWLANHRFDLDTALRLAKEAAPLLKVNGMTLTEALTRKEGTL
jgi:hypothetical protein